LHRNSQGYPKREGIKDGTVYPIEVMEWKKQFFATKGEGVERVGRVKAG